MPSTFLIEFCIPSHLKNEVSCDQHKSWLQLKIFYGIKIKYESKSFESKQFCNEYCLTDLFDAQKNLNNELFRNNSLK